MLDTQIGLSTIGFVDIGTATPLPLGSGTLVKTRTMQGILTCGHVALPIASQAEIGVVQFPIRKGQLQQLRLPVKELMKNAVIWYDNNEDQGRDLAFLPVPDEHMSSLGAKGTIVDLDFQASRAAQPDPDGKVIEAAAGVVGDMTPPATQQENRIVLAADGLINVGQLVAKSRGTANFDLIELEPRPGEDFTLPSTYGGMSGGGMWRIFVREKQDGGYDVVERRLVGVSFYETALPNRHIIGHGPDSVFRHLLSEIIPRWP
jgi:hypothetical protein